jgi:hypothetical protein
VEKKFDNCFADLKLIISFAAADLKSKRSKKILKK